MYENGDVKLKGCFEIDKEYHKDPSMRIVPIALKAYFVDGIPIEETIRNHKDIFDFCLRLKTNSSCTGIYKYLENGEIKELELPRTTRYYISTNGGPIVKKFSDGRITGVNVGFNTTLFNTFIEKDFSEYNINYRFYIQEARKIIDAIEDKQLTLW